MFEIASALKQLNRQQIESMIKALKVINKHKHLMAPFIAKHSSQEDLLFHLADEAKELCLAIRASDRANTLEEIGDVLFLLTAVTVNEPGLIDELIMSIDEKLSNPKQKYR